MTLREFDYAVIVALPEEASYFRDRVRCGALLHGHDHAAWPIDDAAWGNFGKGVLISSGRMGTNFARESAQFAMDEFKVSTIANLGIAGAIDTWLTVGDVVVPEVVFDLTQGGKTGGTPERIVFKHAPDVKNVPGHLPALARRHLSTNSRLMSAINDRLRPRFEPTLFPKTGIKFVSQPIACSPTVGAHEGYKESVGSASRTIAAMEMESAGILAAKASRPIDIVLVRGISDAADFGKDALETSTKDENRRLALEAATEVLASIFLLDAESKGLLTLSGTEISTNETALTAQDKADLDQFDELFGFLVENKSGDRVARPITTIAQILAEDYHGPILLFGGKAVGKTRLFQKIFLKLKAVRQTMEGGLASVSVRASELEFWTASGELDVAATDRRRDDAVKTITEFAKSSKAPIVVLVDGLSRTGHHRVGLVASIVVALNELDNVRLAISGESDEDRVLLYEICDLQINRIYSLVPMDIEDPRLDSLVAAFAAIEHAEDPAAVVQNMHDKDVQSVDLFILNLFFTVFSKEPFQEARVLSQCYERYCRRKLADGITFDDATRESRISEVAEIAFGLSISGSKKFSDIKTRDVAQLLSGHSSVSHYLVALHVINTIMKHGSLNHRHGKKLIHREIDFVFPASVNSFTKQMMASNREIEDAVVVLFAKVDQGTSTLVKSHVAYLAGRVTRDHTSQALEFLHKNAGQAARPGENDHDARMLRRTIFISRAMLHDQAAEIEYVNILLKDQDEAEFNRGFHLEYYGDAFFEPAKKMVRRDDMLGSCNRTFARLFSRIKSRDVGSALIELVTLLSLVQARHAGGVLPIHQKTATMMLLDEHILRQGSKLPANVRGYAGRIREDLDSASFEASTVLQEWFKLPTLERTGWLRRRRDAQGDHTKFWEGQRIESVAEHIWSLHGLAMTFLNMNAGREEKYDVGRVLKMLWAHDLAEARLGDQIHGSDKRAEAEVLWKFGAFSTYAGIGDLWALPEAYQEFADQETMDSRIAQDLDRLQFMLQARIYRDGMSDDERRKCESTVDKFETKTVRAISAMLEKFPAPARFETEAVTY